MDTADQLLRAMSSAVQLFGLYPAGHPQRADAVTDLVVWARRLRQADPTDAPLFALRRAFYLGAELLPMASLVNERLLDHFEDAGIVSVEFAASPGEADLDAFVRMLRGELTTSAPLAGMWVNRTTPSFDVDGPTVAPLDRSYSFGKELLRQTALRAADGRPADVAAAQAIVNDLTTEILRSPAAALLFSATSASGSDVFRRSIDVAVVAIALSNSLRLGHARVAAIGVGALLHDVGMLLVPPEIVDKRDALTPAERELVQRHVVDGAGLIIAAEGGLFHPAAAIALEHHAGVDGSGYPALERPPTLPSRIVAVADAYVAMTSDRPYRPADDRREALRTIAADPRFDPNVVRALAKLVGTVPIGTPVVLSDGAPATVIRPNARFPTRPVVRVTATGEERDLASWDGIDYVWDALPEPDAAVGATD